MKTAFSNDPSYVMDGASGFIKDLKQAGDKATSNKEAVIFILDKLYNLICEANQGVSYYVRCKPGEGIETDFLDGLSKEDWDNFIFNGDRDYSNLESYTTIGCQKLFCELLGNQVLSNVPVSKEDAITHALVNVFSVFNGSNFLHRQFELVYIDYDLFNGQYVETCDISDFLVIATDKLNFDI